MKNRGDLDFGSWLLEVGFIALEERAEELELAAEAKRKEISLVNLQELLEWRRRNFETNLRLRKQFAYWMVALVALSNVVTLSILLLQGFRFFGFQLSQTVVVSAIGATVAELASIFLIIVKYLFHPDSQFEQSLGGSTETTP